jgi:hypothetical protein
MQNTNMAQKFLLQSKATLLAHHNSENAQDEIVSFSNQLDAIKNNLFEGKKGRYLYVFQSDVTMIYDTERRVLLEDFNTQFHPANVFKETTFSSYPTYLKDISDNKLKEGLKGGFKNGVEFHLFDINDNEISVTASVVNSENKEEEKIEGLMTNARIAKIELNKKLENDIKALQNNDTMDKWDSLLKKKNFGWDLVRIKSYTEKSNYNRVPKIDYDIEDFRKILKTESIEEKKIEKKEIGDDEMSDYQESGWEFDSSNEGGGIIMKKETGIEKIPLKNKFFNGSDAEIDSFCNELKRVQNLYNEQKPAIDKAIETKRNDCEKDKRAIDNKFETDIRETESYKEASKMLNKHYNFSVTQGINVLTLYEGKDKKQLKQEAEKTIKTIYSKYGNEIGDAVVTDSVLQSIKREGGKNTLYSESRMNLLTEYAQDKVNDSRLSDAKTENPKNLKISHTREIPNIVK